MEKRFESPFLAGNTVKKGLSACGSLGSLPHGSLSTGDLQPNKQCLALINDTFDSLLRFAHEHKSEALNIYDAATFPTLLTRAKSGGEQDSSQQHVDGSLRSGMGRLSYKQSDRNTSEASSLQAYRTVDSRDRILKKEASTDGSLVGTDPLSKLIGSLWKEVSEISEKKFIYSQKICLDASAVELASALRDITMRNSEKMALLGESMRLPSSNVIPPPVPVVEEINFLKDQDEEGSRKDEYFAYTATSETRDSENVFTHENMEESVEHPLWGGVCGTSSASFTDHTSTLKATAPLIFAGSSPPRKIEDIGLSDETLKILRGHV